MSLIDEIKNNLGDEDILREILCDIEKCKEEMSSIEKGLLLLEKEIDANIEEITYKLNIQEV